MYYEDGGYYGEVVMEPPAKSNKHKPSKASSNTQYGGNNNAASNHKSASKQTKKNKSNNNTKKKQNNTQNKREYDYYEEDYEQETVNRQNFRGGEYGYDEEDYQVSYGNDEYDYNPKAEGFTTVLTVIAAVIIGGILLYFAGQATGIFEQIGLPTQEKGSNDAERAVMPEFVGIDVEEVKKALNSAGLGCKTTFIESTQYAKTK